ncbi:MAG: hypothetical protein NTW25_14160 [Candidatus Kapabacteria bacterium]|nr:hypothetical protein [Candidatus Kapabacteria bacterium]
MKAKKIILILFLSFTFQGELLCINPGRLLVKPGVHFEYTLNEYQKSFTLGLDELMYSKSLVRNKYFYQLDILNFDVIEKDKYNNNELSRSYYLTGFNLAWLIATVEIPRLFKKDDDFTVKDFSYIASIPLILTNSKSYFNLFYLPINRNSNLTSSIFIKSKLDYFSNTNPWWQYKSAIGISFNQLLRAENSHSYGGVSLDIGIEKPFDLINHTIISNKITPFLGIKFKYLIVVFEDPGPCGDF